MSILNLPGRVLALIAGLVGSVIALFITLITVVTFHVGQLFNPSDAPTHSHGFIGFIVFVVGVIGWLLALMSPIAAAVLMLIAGLGMLYVAGGWGVIPLIFRAGGAFIAYLNRPRVEKAR